MNSNQINTQNNTAMPNSNSTQFQGNPTTNIPNQNVQSTNPTKKSNSTLIIILAIVGGVILLPLLILVLILVIGFFSASRVQGNRVPVSNVKTIGDSHYGYVDVPKDWQKYYDSDADTALQYSKDSVYIVSLDVVDTNLTARQVAERFSTDMKFSYDVTDVTNATVTIGKKKKYTAYQVYMYYPDDAKYLVTYWFETEDNVVRYIGLEGAENLTDYTSIPESFRLTN